MGAPGLKVKLEVNPVPVYLFIYFIPKWHVQNSVDSGHLSNSMNLMKEGNKKLWYANSALLPRKGKV